MYSCMADFDYQLTLTYQLNSTPIGRTFAVRIQKLLIIYRRHRQAISSNIGWQSQFSFIWFLTRAKKIRVWVRGQHIVRHAQSYNPKCAHNFGARLSINAWFFKYKCFGGQPIFKVILLACVDTNMSLWLLPIHLILHHGEIFCLQNTNAQMFGFKTKYKT